jgi:hypothetical protein
MIFQVCKVSLEAKVCLEPKVRKEKEDLLDHGDLKETEERLVFLVSLVLLVSVDEKLK